MTNPWPSSKTMRSYNCREDPDDPRERVQPVGASGAWTGASRSTEPPYSLSGKGDHAELRRAFQSSFAHGAGRMAGLGTGDSSQGVLSSHIRRCCWLFESLVSPSPRGRASAIRLCFIALVESWGATAGDNGRSGLGGPRVSPGVLASS